MQIRDCMKSNVISIPSTSSISESAVIFVEHHVGLLPVIGGQGKPIGVLRLGDLLTLELPDFVNLVDDVDFVHDFGAVESTRPALEQLARPVTTVMQPVMNIEETCGLLRAYTLLLQYDLTDMPVVNQSGELVGIVSRVDIGTAVLSLWAEEGDQ